MAVRVPRACEGFATVTPYGRGPTVSHLRRPEPHRQAVCGGAGRVTAVRLVEERAHPLATLAGLGEILAVEIDKPAVGIPGQLRIWCIVDDYYQNVSALRICLAKRILGPEEPVPEQMVDQPTSDTLPRIVLVHAVKLQGD